MERYKIMRKGVFQKIDAFENQINEMATQGWKAISISHDGSYFCVLLERER